MTNDDSFLKYLDGSIISLDGDVSEIRNIARVWLVGLKEIERLGLAEVGLEIANRFLELLDDDKSDLKFRVIHVTKTMIVTNIRQLSRSMTVKQKTL